MAETTGPRAEVLRARDFIGWDVWDAQGEKIGTVGDLLIGRDGRVRYLDVDFGMFRRGHVLLPVSQVDWGEEAMVARWTRDEVRALPHFEPGGTVTAGMLEELARSHPRVYAEGASELPPALPGEARIVPLSQAKDFRLAGGASDLRGWSVFAADRQRVGTVTEMLVDPTAMKVRYLDVDLDDDLFTLTDDRHVLVPTESVDLQERSRDVWIRGVRAEEVARLPAYMGGAVDPLVERSVGEAFARGDPMEPPAY